MAYLALPAEAHTLNTEGQRTMISLSTITKNGVINVKAAVKPKKVLKGDRIYPSDAPLIKPLIHLVMKTPHDWEAIRRFALNQSGLRQFNQLFNMSWNSVSELVYEPASKLSSFGMPSIAAAVPQQYQQVQQPVPLVPQQFSAPRANTTAFDWGAVTAPVAQQTMFQQPSTTFQQPSTTFQPSQPSQPTFQPSQPSQPLFSGGVDNGVPSASSAMPTMNAFAQGQVNQLLNGFVTNPSVVPTSTGTLGERLVSPQKPSPISLMPPQSSPGPMAQSVVPMAYAAPAPAFTTTTPQISGGNAAVPISDNLDEMS